MKQSNSTKIKKNIGAVLFWIAVVFVASRSHAAEYKLFYVNNSGQQVDESAAMIKILKGETMYKCQSVEASLNKTGTSISVKNVKKPTLASKPFRL